MPLFLPFLESDLIVVEISGRGNNTKIKNWFSYWNQMKPKKTKQKTSNNGKYDNNLPLFFLSFSAFLSDWKNEKEAWHTFSIVLSRVFGSWLQNCDKQNSKKYKGINDGLNETWKPNITTQKLSLEVYMNLPFFVVSINR